MAWKGILNAYDASCILKQQIVESEHLMKALLKSGQANIFKGWNRQ